MSPDRSRTSGDPSPAGAALVGFLVVLAGLTILGVGVGAIELPPDQVRVPHWVVAVTGVFFIGIGGLFLERAWNVFSGSAERGEGDESFSVAGWLLGGVGVTAFAVATGWIAFGPGDRAFGGTLSFLFVRLGSSDGGELGGRIAFGIVAVLSTALAVYGWTYGIRRLRAGSRRDGPEGHVERE